VAERRRQQWRLLQDWATSVDALAGLRDGLQVEQSKQYLMMIDLLIVMAKILRTL
jgi:hypothetical protein